MVAKIKRSIVEHPIESLSLIGIILVAFFLRIYKIHGYMRFLGDEGRDALVILHIIRNFDFPLIGPVTSVGNMYAGPLFYYMMLVPMAITGSSPISAAVMVVLICTAAVGLVYYLGRLFFGRVAGLAAAAFYAVAYIPVASSRSSWNPYPLPFFSLLIVLGLYKTIAAKRSRWLWLVAIAYAFALQMHLMALNLLPMIGLFWLGGLWWFWKQKISVRTYILDSIIAAALFGLLMSPLLLFDLKHNFQNFNAYKAYFTMRETTINVNPLNTFDRLIDSYVNLYGARLLAYGFIATGVIASTAIVVFAIVQGGVYALHRRFSLGYALLVTWLITGVVGVSLVKSHLYDHYFGFFSPAIYILFGLLIAQIWHIHKYTKLLALVVLGYFIGLSMFINPLQEKPGYQLQRTQKIVQHIMREVGDQPFNFALISKNNYDAGYRFYFEYWNKPPVILDTHRLNETKTAHLYVVCEDQVCQPTTSPAYEIAAYGWSKIASETTVEGIKVYRLEPKIESN